MDKITSISFCYHCGDNCNNEEVYYNDKSFCCNGCKSVFQILNHHQLNQYYDIEATPGIKKSSNHQYQFLDIEEITAPLFDFVEGDIRVVRLFLPAIHCSSCVWLLENLNHINKGISSSQVNFLKKEALISFNIKEISFRELATLVDQIGYVPKFDAAQKEKVGNKKMYLKLGLTFFCFGNIMLFSFPEYLNPDVTFLIKYRNFFALLIFAFSLPVLFYSAKDYLIAAIKAVAHRVINLDVPIALGIVTLYIKSAYDIFSGQGPGYMDSFAGFVLFLLLGKWFQDKTYQALSFDRDYKSYFPLAVTKMVEGKEVVRPVKEVIKGDTLLIKNDEIIPTDALILKGEANIDYSFVTGESTPIKKQIGEQLYAGGKQLGSHLMVEVINPLNQSYLTQLWNQHVFKKKDNNSANSINDRLSEYFIVVVLLIAFLAAITWSFINPNYIVNVVVSILIVACPCALALSIPFTFGNTLRLAGENKLYLKNVNVIEKLAKVTDIVFDKTGTLTHQNQSNIAFVGKRLIGPQQQMILSLVRNSTHPLSRMLYEHLNEKFDLIDNVADFKEVAGKGIYGKVWNKSVYIGSKEWTGASETADSLSTRVYVKIDEILLGFYQVENKYRIGLENTIKELEKTCNLHVLSGDNESEKNNLTRYFSDVEHLHFNQKPIDKLNYIKSIQKDNAVVMMVGDGLNDAGALKQSDVGIVVAEDVYNFTPACDGILDGTQFNKIPQFIRLGKYSLSVLKVSYVVSLLYNVIGLSFALTNHLSPLIAAILMPSSSISVVIITTLLIRGREL